MLDNQSVGWVERSETQLHSLLQEKPPSRTESSKSFNPINLRFRQSSSLPAFHTNHWSLTTDHCLLRSTHQNHARTKFIPLPLRGWNGWNPFPYPSIYNFYRELFRIPGSIGSIRSNLPIGAHTKPLTCKWFSSIVEDIAIFMRPSLVGARFPRPIVGRRDQASTWNRLCESNLLQEGAFALCVQIDWDNSQVYD